MRRPLILLAALAVAGCQLPPVEEQPPTLLAPRAEPAAPATGAPDVPHIYMAIQPVQGGTTSVIFAIDSARNQTPLDDPAIRLSPENGKCNPQEMRRYAFPIDRVQRPAFGPEDATRGIDARSLPNFMAESVTAEMLRLGVIQDPEQSRPQNVCTRKLWEQLIVNQSQGGATG